MGTDLITIVVPIYKVEKYLEECITSLINQTYENIEIILVDDGSPDNCGKICDKYATQDKRIKVIHKENGGLSDARNCGIDMAQGRYITFVDSDDYIDVKYIECLYNAIKINNTQISQCNILRVSDKKEIVERLGYCDSTTKLGKELLKEAYGVHWIENVVVWNKMYNIELFDKIRYPVGKIHEDEYTTYKILYNIDKIAIVNEYLYNYRQSEDSIIGRKFNIKRLDILEAFEERLKFFKERNEKELYELTQKQYLESIQQYYQQVLLYIEESKNVLANLMKKYKNEYKKSKTNTTISKKTKMKMRIFYYNPQLLYTIQKIKKVIRKKI